MKWDNLRDERLADIVITDGKIDKYRHIGVKVGKEKLKFEKGQKVTLEQEDILKKLDNVIIERDGERQKYNWVVEGDK